MAIPQVTITLGSSGQKVVKDSWGVSDGSRGAVAASTIGSKRSLADSYGSSASHPSDGSKRFRDGESVRSYGYSSHIDDAHLGPKDLRFKLTRKRISREIDLKNEGHKEMELRANVSRASRSHDELLNSIPSRSIRAVEAPNVDSMRSSYASWTSSAGGTRSPERILRSSNGISYPRKAADEMPQMPSARQFSTSGIERALTTNPSVLSRPKVPMITGPKQALDSGKLPMELPTAAGSIFPTPYQPLYLPRESQPLTVSSWLHSLGLGKYYINFQAEEVDMAVLRQMGEADLKDLGIPMGPRKKILHALLARRNTTQLPHTSTTS